MNITVSYFEDCVRNNRPYWQKIIGNTFILLVEKYAFVPYFDIRVLTKDGNRIKESYPYLSPFDTFDMIRERISPLNDK